ncbi:hypothetical protein [Streptomyces sp. A5-4]|uniref:hypothetical protein n=1 Tax=Streptomyces sp. A5-4 TaxID=3384771 RepID=UPI003DAA2085
MGGSPHTRLTFGRRRYVAVAGGLAVVLAATVTGPAQAAGAGPAACPESLTAKATCYSGQDANGAYYSIAIPKGW